MALASATDPLPWTRDVRFEDVDAQAAQFHGYDQHYQQLSRGPFQGHFRSFFYGEDLSINLEGANRVLAQAASAPSGRYAVCFLDEGSPSCALNAQVLTQDEIVLCPQNACMEATTGEGVSVCCMDLARELLPHEELNVTSARVFTDPIRAARLRELVSSGIAASRQRGSANWNPASIRNFKSSMADLLWQIADGPTEAPTDATRHYGTARTMRIYRQARDCIHQGLEDGISVANLCRRVGVSRRSLEHVFQAVIGTGPSTYVRVVQLNTIRRDLMSPANAHLSIGDIAASRGLWHWSRFTKNYQTLFGELPSQTRARHGGSQKNVVRMGERHQ